MLFHGQENDLLYNKCRNLSSLEAKGPSGKLSKPGGPTGYMSSVEK